ncbi:MAG: HAD family phosphatase [Anaerolineaceae bacterium]|nr:HAD family phosphatase [Anaerolineaceae bacterium]
MNSRELRNALVLSILANLLAAYLIYIVTDWLNRFLTLNIPPIYIAGAVLTVSAIISIVVIIRTYQDIFERISYIRFLRNDSASQSFELLIEIAKRLVLRLEQQEDKEPDPSSVKQYVLPPLRQIVQLRRQPMQIVLIDCERIVERAEEYQTPLSVAKQIIYYLEFMLAYKRMALPRIIRQTKLYMSAFNKGGYTDYVVIYGHSTNVVSSIIAGYKDKEVGPFPVVIVEDLQYHEQSLGEHKIVSRKLKRAGIPFFTIKFDQIRLLFDPSVTQITDLSENRLPLLRKRRLHGFIGCERIDTDGNTLIPSTVRGVPSESAQFVQEMEAFSQAQGGEGETPARIIVVAESYKVRDFNRGEDSETHVPLRSNLLRTLPYILGLTKHLPALSPVLLFYTDASKIYVHVNELGIFPNILGKIDLKYCESVFSSETSLLGLFAKPIFLKYQIFDEIQAVLFDFNGVIVDDEELHYHAFAKVLNDLEVEFTPDKYDELCRGRSDADGFNKIKKKFGISEEIPSLVEKKHNAYLDAVTSSPVHSFPGVRRLLEELLRRGYKLALVTASNRQEVESVLYYLSLRDYFSVIITDDDVDESKPSPQGFLLASHKLGIPPARCLVIEDSPSNTDAILSQTKMRAVGVGNNRNVKFPEPTYHCESLEELLIA